MALSQNLHTYADVRRVLDTAKQMGGGRYRLATKSEAVRWRQRAYKFRILLREQLAAGVLVPGYQPETPFDDMRLTVEDNVVVIKFGFTEGVLETFSGDAVPLVNETEEGIEDPLLLEAEELAKRLGADD